MQDEIKGFQYNTKMMVSSDVWVLCFREKYINIDLITTWRSTFGKQWIEKLLYDTCLTISATIICVVMHLKVVSVLLWARWILEGALFAVIRHCIITFSGRMHVFKLKWSLLIENCRGKTEMLLLFFSCSVTDIFLQVFLEILLRVKANKNGSDIDYICSHSMVQISQTPTMKPTTECVAAVSIQFQPVCYNWTHSLASAVCG